MIYGILGWQDCGKSMLARALADKAVNEFSMKPIIANMSIKGMPGSISLSNEALRIWMRKMISEGITNQVVIIDEIDRVFPARFWSKPEQTETLVGLWQDEKLGNCIFYTAHLGIVVDKMVRDATRMLAFPEYYPEYDVVEFMECDGRYNRDAVKQVYPASYWFDKYDRWEVIR